MLFSGRYKPTLGLDIGASGIKMVEIKPAGRKWRLTACAFAPLPSGAMVDGQIKRPEPVIEALKGLLEENQVKTKEAALSVSGQAVIIKTFTVPKMSLLDLEDQISLEAEEYIPFDMDEVSIDFQILGEVIEEEEPRLEVIAAACKNDTVKSIIDVVEKAGLTPALMDVDIFTLQTAHDHLFGEPKGKKKPPAGKKKGKKSASPSWLDRLLRKTPPPTAPDAETVKDEEAGEKTETLLLVNAGANLINLNFIEEGENRFSRDQLFGFSKLTESIQGTYDVDPEKALAIQGGESQPEGYDEEVLSPFLEQFFYQITESIDFYLNANPGTRVDRLILSGGGALIAEVQERLAERTALNVEVADPLGRLRLGKEAGLPFLDQSPLFMIALGLALRGKDR